MSILTDKVKKMMQKSSGTTENTAEASGPKVNPIDSWPQSYSDVITKVGTKRPAPISRQTNKPAKETGSLRRPTHDTGFVSVKNASRRSSLDDGFVSVRNPKLRSKRNDGFVSVKERSREIEAAVPEEDTLEEDKILESLESNNENEISKPADMADQKDMANQKDMDEQEGFENNEDIEDVAESEESPATEEEQAVEEKPASAVPAEAPVFASSSVPSEEEPDNVLTLPIATVKNLQIGYHGETLHLFKSKETDLIIKEYIGGLEGSEYYGKVTANRFKTTVRYGRREEVNKDTHVEIYLPESWAGELQVSTQYGDIITEEDWKTDRFVAEATQGIISLKEVQAPRIRLVTSSGEIHIEHAVGFTDIHTVSGAIHADVIDGGASLETSDSIIDATFHSLSNIIEAETLNGSIALRLPKGYGMKIDGVSKRGDITSNMEELEIRTKPGNIRVISGMVGKKPFQRVSVSDINGNISLDWAEE